MGCKPKGSKEKESTRLKKSAYQKGRVTVVKKEDGSKHRMFVNEAKLLVEEGTHHYQRTDTKSPPITEEHKRRLSELKTGKPAWNKGKVGVCQSKYKGIPRPRCCCIICGAEVDSGNLIRHHKHNQSSLSAID